jgi:hypothetical protein
MFALRILLTIASDVSGGGGVVVRARESPNREQ